MLVAYNPKINKNVILLSSLHNTGTVNPDTKKLDIIQFYSYTKGGVDVFDKLCHAYTAKGGSRRWPMRNFYFLLDAARLNAFVLCRLNNNASSMRRSDFLKSLILSLVEPFMRQRVENPRLPKLLPSEIRETLGLTKNSGPDPTNQNQPRTRRRCYLCKRKDDKKTINTCEKYERPTCKRHEIIKKLCVECDTDSEGDF